MKSRIVSTDDYTTTRIHKVFYKKKKNHYLPLLTFIELGIRRYIK